jgi:MFS transporter, BCD family, chlorophyll transporter
MSRGLLNMAQAWTRLPAQALPFLVAGTALSPARLLRLSMFQLTVGMAAALLIGTLNRVMIVELGVAAWLVAAMAGLPLLVAPLRALIGFRSDTHRSALGWRRVPYIWMGTLLQFGGLAIMPFALILLSGDSRGPAWLGPASAALAFLLAGAGMQVTQTAGLALATDQATPDRRPAVVALMQFMLLAGMVASSLVFGVVLADYSPLRLIQVVQGAALLTLVINLWALWGQEERRGAAAAFAVERAQGFRAAWRVFAARAGALRLLVAVGLGSAGFTMQDIILEPYGGEILGMSVAETTALTALTAGGAIAAFVVAWRRMAAGADVHRVSAAGALVGIVAFAAVIFAAPLESPMLFRAGAAGIGFGGGLFGAGTLAAAMGLDTGGLHGLALGAWGAVQSACAGAALALGGGLRDAVSDLAVRGMAGEALASASTGYSVVYHIEILLLFTTLVALGPLVRTRRSPVLSPR